MARLLISALKYAGHDVLLASKLRSWNAKGENQAQKRIESRASASINRLKKRFLSEPVGKRPDAWFTYHLYYKASDLIGPEISKALGIPYNVAEASHAPKRAKGEWASGHEAAEAAIRHADHIISLNPTDTPCVQPLLKQNAAITHLKPFLDASNLFKAANQSARNRDILVRKLDLDPTVPILVTVAMMRDGDKFASYRNLADALERLKQTPWQLVIVGDGPKRKSVEDLFANFNKKITRFLGKKASREIADILSSADLFLWPAVNEAYGMAILEAQAAGRPVIAANSGGVGQLIRDGSTGILTEKGNIQDFADAIKSLLSDPNRRLAMGEAAKNTVEKDHTLEEASKIIDFILVESNKGYSK